MRQNWAHVLCYDSVVCMCANRKSIERCAVVVWYSFSHNCQSLHFINALYFVNVEIHEMLACIVDAKMFLGAPACSFSAEKRESHTLGAALPLTFILYVLCVVVGLVAVSVPKKRNRRYGSSQWLHELCVCRRNLVIFGTITFLSVYDECSNE